ncbi:hypothetical protein DITRI_Ditri07aG0034600 [Diplodiscus trichospermus]
MRLKWFWMFLTVLLLEGWSKGCLEHERIALLQLKSFFDDPYDLSNWTDVKGSNCCQWARVECSNTSRRVIRLSLNYTRNWREDNYGYLNASLFLPFEELKSLYLPDNRIAGFVDSKGFERLSSKLDKLKILDLSDNYFNESILASLSEFSSLKSLNLASNFLNGSNTYGFERLSSKLDKLEILDLSDNHNFTESILASLSKFSSLKSLYLASNFLMGSNTNGFKWLSGLSNLETLDLSGNYLENSSFAYISRLSNLKSLNLNHNQLQGSIDARELNNLAKLKELYMSGNQIESFRSFQDNENQLKLINLEELDLSNNLFNNSILAQLNGLSNLKSLNLGSNQLKGSTILEELEALNNLEELDFSDNELQEFLPPKVGSLKKLRVARLERTFTNESTVSLLQVIEAFSSVKTLSLGDNYLNNTISTQELHLSSNVEELFLDYSHLSNNILESIGELTSLKTLTLSGCSLTGFLPTKGWCDLQNLEELDLSENALKGTIPSCLNNLTYLYFLDISNNNFEVPISFLPFANHSHLKALFVDQNNLVRESSFQTWAPTPVLQLEAFSMYNCTINGPPKQLPDFLYYQYNLSFLQLSYNNFGGKIPSWLLENNTRLQQFFLIGNSYTGPLRLPRDTNVDMFQIDMSQNKIQGEIPMNICSTFPNLEVFSLFQNAFKGNIPPCLGGLKSLWILDLSYNNFSGGIPAELAKSNSIVILRLSNNSLSGKIVPAMISSEALTSLYLDGNNFDGEIPQIDISTVSFLALSNIDLSNNHLSGRLPRWLWNMSKIEILDLSNNHLDGLIPFELCNLNNLGFLDLSQNNFSGSLPSCFNPPYISHVHLSRNRLSGPMPRALYNSSSLVTLDLSQNNLTGKIPNWIGTLSALSILTLKANHFEGEIPSQLCQLNSLSIMDLSQNKLSGHIPSCLSNLTLDPKDSKILQDIFEIGKQDIFEIEKSKQRYSYSYVEEQVEFMTKKQSYMFSGNILKYMSGIDLSCNRLMGQIPSEIGNLSGLHSLNLSHNNLTGLIPSTISKLKQIESLDLSNNKLCDSIPIQLTELNSLAVFNVSYNNLSGSIPYKAQFATFDESSYMGNRFLCGPPLHENYPKPDSSLITEPKASDGEKEGGLVDKISKLAY